jgi:4-alpha-glucanotransferase
MIRAAFASVADVALVPMQDVLGLGSEARMNRPARETGNWQWRFRAEAVTPAIEARLRSLTETYGRCIR